MDPDLLVDEDGVSLHGRCGHCGIRVDNYDENHRVSSIMRGGRGVECVLRGDIRSGEGAPLKVAPAQGASARPPATGPADGGRAPTEGE